MSIVEFLLARIAEDEEAEWERIEAEILRLRRDGLPTTRSDLLTMEESDHWRRPLAKIEAMRRIVELHPVYDDSDQHDCPGEWPNHAGPGDPCPTLLALASVYAAHPECQDVWRA